MNAALPLFEEAAKEQPLLLLADALRLLGELVVSADQPDRVEAHACH